MMHNPMMMTQAPQTNYFQHLQERPNLQKEMNNIWDSAEVHQQQQPFMEMGAGMMGPGMFQQPWMNPMMQAPIYQQPAFVQPAEKVQVEEVKESAQDRVDQEVKATSNSMIEVLSKSDNPKHRNSKFLKFLKKLAHGAYTIEEEQLVKKADKLVEFRSMEQDRMKDEVIRQREEEEKKAVELKSAREEKEKLFKKMWDGEEQIDEELCK